MKRDTWQRATYALVACSFVLLWCGPVSGREDRSILVGEIMRVRERVETHPDRSCSAIAHEYRRAYHDVRAFYRELPRRIMPVFGSNLQRVEGMELPPRMSRRDREELDALVEDAALHAARCASELPDGGERAMSFWIYHANKALFNFDEPEHLFEHVSSKPLNATREALVEKMNKEAGGHSVLVGMIARERAHELDIRMRRLSQRIALERTRRHNSIALLVALTLFVLVLATFGSKLRPGMARVPLPRAEHEVLLPHKVRVGSGSVMSAMLVSWRAWWRRLAVFMCTFGIAAAMLVTLGAGIMSYGLDESSQGRGSLVMLAGWAISMCGMALLTHKLWYRRQGHAREDHLAPVFALDSHAFVAHTVEDLQRSYFLILLRHRDWLSLRPTRDPLQRALLVEIGVEGRACVMLWKARQHSSTLPPFEYTMHIGRAYAESEDEWGNLYEDYWDMLVELGAPGEHTELLQRAWESRSWWQLGFGGAPLEPAHLESLLTGAMLSGRRWRRVRWWPLFFEREVVREQARQLVWVAEQGASQVLFWVDESLECVTPDGEVVHIEEHAYIRIAHAADFSQAQYVEWGEHLADHELAPCMSQLDRYPETWDVPDTAKWIILESGQQLHDTRPHEPSEFGVRNLGTLAPFDVMVFGYENPRSAGLAVIPLDDGEEVAALSSLPPLLYAELCFLLRHGVTSSAALQDFYEGVHVLG